MKEKKIWAELIELAQNECVFGEPLDRELFKTCMKDAAEFFALGNKKSSYKTNELELFALIKGYSYIPAVTESEFSEEFEASTHAADELAQAIIYPELYTFDGSKLIYEFMLDGDFKPVAYDFETGDLSDYIELVKMHYWDW